MSGSGWVYLSPEGLEKLTGELKRLKTVERPRIVAEISRARDHGDLSENAEYHAAKERQVLLERKIAELEDTLRRAKTVDHTTTDSDKAYLLSYVVVRELRSGEEIRYQLVSPEEADFDADRISVQSPVGRALLGKGRGDRVTVQVPAGQIVYDVLDVQRPS
ncbi:MAG: transcription elongation factor GreA [Candidatus Zixiibacteriota bacterium]